MFSFVSELANRSVRTHRATVGQAQISVPRSQLNIADGVGEPYAAGFRVDRWGVFVPTNTDERDKLHRANWSSNAAWRAALDSSCCPSSGNLKDAEIRGGEVPRQRNACRVPAKLQHFC